MTHAERALTAFQDAGYAHTMALDTMEYYVAMFKAIEQTREPLVDLAGPASGFPQPERKAPQPLSESQALFLGIDSGSIGRLAEHGVGLYYMADMGAPQANPVPKPNLEEAVRHAINCHSAENGSDTPDFILAKYLLGCLAAFNVAVNARERWYSR